MSQKRYMSCAEPLGANLYAPQYWNKWGEQVRDYRDMIEHNEHIKGDFISHRLRNLMDKYISLYENQWFLLNLQFA